LPFLSPSRFIPHVFWLITPSHMWNLHLIVAAANTRRHHVIVHTGFRSVVPALSWVSTFMINVSSRIRPPAVQSHLCHYDYSADCLNWVVPYRSGVVMPRSIICHGWPVKSVGFVVMMCLLYSLPRVHRFSIWVLSSQMWVAESHPCDHTSVMIWWSYLSR